MSRPFSRVSRVCGAVCVTALLALSCDDAGSSPCGDGDCCSGVDSIDIEGEFASPSADTADPNGDVESVLIQVVYLDAEGHTLRASVDAWLLGDGRLFLASGSTKLPAPTPCFRAEGGMTFDLRSADGSAIDGMGAVDVDVDPLLLDTGQPVTLWGGLTVYLQWNMWFAGSRERDPEVLA